MGTDSLRQAGRSKAALLNAAVFACLITATSLLAALGYTAEGACPTNPIGLDTSATNKFLTVHFGHAWGQVIKADYTQVSSFTVWRRTDPDTILDPMHLYVTEVD